ncbi:uncharacterized protein TRUGW13939_07482 [Talaromyces rugulosus]|uniref:NADPH--cytochrome P450 reductase n=1 Tax=Talaromyces rugulosus TaxID=121627 RepID=A0A7H8R2T9_TALRU|nr:uncharacterized protein TRUGW13939_07482 [Talaromyces rugulosus]QKX60338.1 hypothetical protein TRUGW13939_07482 [Talaromyces rugulosus]
MRETLMAKYLSFSTLHHGIELDDVTMLIICMLICWKYLQIKLTKPNPYHNMWFERPQGNQKLKTVTQERNIAKIVESQKRDIIIFWASQSGTSERLATQLSRHLVVALSKRSFVADFSDFDIETVSKITSSIPVLMLLSTYGEGNPPDNAVQFFDWLTNSSEKVKLEHLQFAILGVGNSTYKHYNKFAQDVQSSFVQLGAKSLLNLHLADDALGLTEEGFLCWKEAVVKILCGRFGFVEQAIPYQPGFSVRFAELPRDVDSYQPQFRKQTQNIRAMSRLSAIRKVTITKTKILSADPSKPCLHLDIDISHHPELKYETGDHVGIWPVNFETEVEGLRSALGISTEDMYKRLVISSQTPESEQLLTFSDTMTLASLFKHHLEICSPVSRQFLQDLKQFAPTSEAERWISAISSDGATYSKYKASNRITLSSILMLASAGQPWNIPFSFVIESLGLIQPRYYSIASASAVYPRQISLTVSLLSIHLDESDDIIHGVTSTYISKLCDNKISSSTAASQGQVPSKELAGLFCHVRKSTFKLPASESQPMLTIATGTGVAPFRGFIQHRVRLYQIGCQVGRTILIFGCRDKNSHIYMEEFEEAERILGDKLDIIVAYSQDRSQPQHIQDKIKKYSREIVDLIVENRAKTYLCGSTRMAKEVRRLIGCFYAEYKNFSPEEVEGFQERQTRSKQWQEDVWG